jgi:hypothetical protein
LWATITPTLKKPNSRKTLMTDPDRIHRELEPILTRYANQFYLTPITSRFQFWEALSWEFYSGQVGLRVPTPSPEALRAWFTQYVQVYSTAFLLTELSRLSNSLAGLVAKLTAMAEHVIDCQQRGLPVTSQTQALFAVNERFEFLTRQALVDPRIGSPCPHHPGLNLRRGGRSIAARRHPRCVSFQKV